MKLFVAVALLCTVVVVSTFPHSKNELSRFRRGDDPNRRIRVQGNVPVGNSRQQPSVDVNYEHRLSDTGRRTVDAYGGLNVQSGRAQPHAGAKFEHKFDNGMFVSGHAQGQTGRHGRIEPNLGIGAGVRFRRNVEGDEDAH